MSAAPDFSSRRPGHRARPLDTGMLVLAGLAVVASAYSAAASWTKARAVEESVARVRGELAEAKSQAGSLEARTGRGPLALFASRALLTTVAPPPRVLGELEAVMPGDVRLEALSLSYGERVRLELRVAARHADSYDTFLARLGASAAFAEVVPGAESREGELRASMSVTYRPRGLP